MNNKKPSTVSNTTSKEELPPSFVFSISGCPKHALIMKQKGTCMPWSYREVITLNNHYCFWKKTLLLKKMSKITNSSCCTSLTPLSHSSVMAGVTSGGILWLATQPTSDSGFYRKGTHTLHRAAVAHFKGKSLSKSISTNYWAILKISFRVM